MSFWLSFQTNWRRGWPQTNHRGRWTLPVAGWLTKWPARCPFTVSFLGEGKPLRKSSAEIKLVTYSNLSTGQPGPTALQVFELRRGLGKCPEELRQAKRLDSRAAGRLGAWVWRGGVSSRCAIDPKLCLFLALPWMVDLFFFWGGNPKFGGNPKETNHLLPPASPPPRWMVKIGESIRICAIQNVIKGR